MGTYLVEPILPEEKVELESELLVSIEAPDHALEEIFSKVDKVQLSSEEVNAFWNTLAEAEQVSVSGNSELLSYEQAIRLGLSPEEEQGI